MVPHPPLPHPRLPHPRLPHPPLLHPPLPQPRQPGHRAPGRALHGLLASALLAATAAATAAPAAGSQQRLFVQVEVPEGIEVETLRAEVDRLGQRAVIELADDGRIEADIPGDGVWLGELSGAYARSVNLSLMLGFDDDQRAVFAGVLRTDDARLDTLGFRLQHAPQGVVAVRTPAPHPGSGGETYELLQLVAAFGWGLLVLAWIAVLVLGGGRGRARGGR